MRFSRNAGLGALALLAAILFGGETAAPHRTEQAAVQDHQDEQRFLEHLKVLAAPEMEGRGAGTAGLERASTYIADQFKKAGLQPAGGGGVYAQAFPLITGAEPGPANHMAVNSGGPLRFKVDFSPVSFSSNGKVVGPVIFAGYGITAPEFNYDDYAGLDVKGKIVVVLRYEPSGFVKGKQEKTTFHAHLANKAINARNRGASALLLVNANTGSGGQADELIEFGKIAGPDDVRIPMVQVKRSIVDSWLKDTTLAALQSKIESPASTGGSARPASFALPEKLQISLEVDVTRKQAVVHNVLGYLPGKSKEYIVIGAHYDHVGYGHQYSMAPSMAGQIHPGADDNASGTAGLLELARHFSERRTKQERGILFAAFAAEELGLLGSARWVKEPTMPLKDAVAMINLDMIGRVTGSKLYVGGVQSGTTFEGLVKTAATRYEFNVDQSFRGASSSDHASFISKNIPSLFFFSGLHKDYHKPSDTWDKINAADSSKVIHLVADVAASLVADASRPQFVKAKPVSEGKSATPGGSSSSPYFGVTPDGAPLEPGVLFAEISAGSPAEAAGLQAGDILIAYGDQSIGNTYDFTFALRSSKAGETVRVKFLRAGKPMSADVTLAVRE